MRTAIAQMDDERLAAVGHNLPSVNEVDQSEQDFRLVVFRC